MLIYLRYYLLIVMLFVLISENLTAQEGGYADKISVAQGDTINFHISTENPEFTLKFYHYEKEKTFISQVESVQGEKYDVPQLAYEKGCDWPVTYNFVVPANWESGIYGAEFPTSEGDKGILFIVKEKSPGSSSRILFVASPNTWQAYNNFGGKSLYGYNSSDGEQAVKVSFMRPFDHPFWPRPFYEDELKFIEWSNKENLNIAYAANYDLDKDPNLVNNYDVVIIGGHNEYFTYEERAELEKYINSGGKLMILSGNTCWWQVRFEDNYKTMVCYKWAATDPLRGVADSLVTLNWWVPPVNNPENSLIGVSFRDGGYINNFGTLPSSEGYGDYTAYNTFHWIYKGTELNDGDEFGYDAEVVGNETDGTPFEWKDGIPTAKGEHGTPKNFRILAISPAQDHNNENANAHATMGIFYTPAGGAVFNASTIHWNWGLTSDPTVQKITLNVLNKFLANKLPPEITSWKPADVESRNINKEDVYINNRNLMLNKDESLQFEISAEDPYNGEIKYFWKENGRKVSENKSFAFTKTNEAKKIEITGFAYNNKDTSSIQWKLFGSELAFASDPDTIVKPGKYYFYKVKIFNKHNDQLNLELKSAPDWLTLNRNNTLSGTAPETSGEYSVDLNVKNQHNQIDEQRFNIYVTETTDTEGNFLLPKKFSLYQNYPNPFNPSTTIKYSLPEASYVSLKIYNSLGEEVKTLFEGYSSSGIYKLEWDGKNNKHKKVSSGLYLYRLATNNKIKTKKMILLK